MKTKQIVLTLNSVLDAAMLAAMIVLLNGLEWYVRLIAYVFIAASTVCGVVFFVLEKTSLQRVTFVVTASVFVVFACFVILNLVGLFDSFSDMQKIKELILQSGNWGRVVFVLIQILQVVILPAPGFLFYVVGTQIYGPAEALLLASIGVVCGSVIAFSLGKIFGKTVVVWCVGKETTEHYASLFAHKGKLLFIIMQLLPFFPDDVLCMIAGLTSMSYLFFIAVIVLVRPLYIAAVCYLGTGDLIPFSGWGIPVWISIFAMLAVAFILYSRYQDRIEEWFRNVFGGGKAKKRTQRTTPTGRGADTPAALGTAHPLAAHPTPTGRGAGSAGKTARTHLRGKTR